MRNGRTARFITGVVAALAIVGGTGLAASAQEGVSPGDDEVLESTISVPSSLDPSCSNEDITVTTTNLLPGSTATFTFFSDPVVLGSVVVGDDGVASLTFDLPAGTTIGAHRVETSGTNDQGVAETISVDIQVLTCATGPSGPGTDAGGSSGGGGGADLARTGTDLQLPVRLGIVALAGGAALILATRKRQAQA